MLGFIVHWTGTAVCNAYGIHNLTDASLRASQIAVAHLVPLLTFRQLSLVADLYGVSLSTYHTIHQSLGVIATLQAAVHAIIALQGIKISSTDAIIGLLVRILLTEYVSLHG